MHDALWYLDVMPTEILFISDLQSVLSGPLAIATIVFCARWMIFLFVPLAAATSFGSRRANLRHSAYEAAWSGLLALVVATVLGVMIGRERPFNTSENVTLLIPPPASVYSLPSAHTSVAFAIAAALAWGDGLLGIVAFLMAFAVAFGRIASGVHYPTDVFAGMFVGVSSFLLIRHMHHIMRSRRKDMRAPS